MLFARNADELVPPASMSKLMVLLMLFMALKAGELQADAEFLMSEYAWRTGSAPSRAPAMFVPLGKTAKVEDLVKGIVVQSANDAAISVAENMKGSEPLFAEAMTAEARRLGLKKSVFKNATGFLPSRAPDDGAGDRPTGAPPHQGVPGYYPLFSQREFLYRTHKFTTATRCWAWWPGSMG